jgi:hypothetical protein
MSTPYSTPLSSGHGPHRAHESSRSDKSPPFSVFPPQTPAHPSSRRTSHSAAGRPVHMLHHRTQSLELDMSQWPIAPAPPTPLASSKLALAYASPNREVSPASTPDSPLADPDLAPPSMRRRGRAIPLPPTSPIATAHAPSLHGTSKLSSANSATLSRVRRCLEAVSLVGHVSAAVDCHRVVLMLIYRNSHPLPRSRSRSSPHHCKALCTRFRLRCLLSLLVHTTLHPWTGARFQRPPSLLSDGNPKIHSEAVRHFRGPLRPACSYAEDATRA